MFSRRAVQALHRPLKIQQRRYATSPPNNGSSSLLYGGIAVALAGAGYYYYSQSSTLPATQGKPEKAAPSDNPKPAFTGGDQGYVSLKLKSIEDVNHNTKKFRFALPEEDSVSGLKIASALLTKYKGPDMEKAVMRPYTPVSDEDERGFLDLMVKKYPNGPMSEHLHSMQPEDTLEFKGPLPKYSWAPNKHTHIALIAGGTGITPMYQLVRAIFKNPEDKTKVTLVFGNIKEEDILLRKEFEELENTYPQRFRAFYVLNEPPKDTKMIKGMINKDLLKTVLPEPKTENIKVFVCGPPGLYKAIAGPKAGKDQGELDGILKELGYDKEQVYKF